MSMPQVDEALAEWGNRLFYGPPRKPRKGGRDIRLSAGAVRMRISALVAPGATQVMVKVTGGGRGMRAIAAHFRYISRLGKPEVGGKGMTLELEDDRGERLSGADDLKALERTWRVAGGHIPETSRRREAFNIILSMPAGTPPGTVLDAARAFAKETFEGHKYVLALHDDTCSPHVHLAVRAERMDGVRLNPRKDDLRQWRERFAARLQDRGINAVATRATVRGRTQAPQAIWRLKTPHPFRAARPVHLSQASVTRGRDAALEALGQLEAALSRSSSAEDRRLASELKAYVQKHFAGESQQVTTTRHHSRGPAQS